MNRIILFILILFGVFACRKDNYIKPTSTATPYNLVLPGIIEQYLPPMDIPMDNPLTEEGVELGRKLFYDTKLSANNTQACASCHSPENSFTDINQFSNGIDGLDGNRNSMPLINIGWMTTLFWDGSAPSIEYQAFAPVVNPIEMHNTWINAVSVLQNDPFYPNLFELAFGTSTIDSVLVSKALAQFERTLISGNAPFDKYLRGEATGMTELQELEAYQGFALFMDETKGDCFHCHGDSYNPLWTDNIFHNNGLDAIITDKGLGEITGDPNDDGKFKTPTLRNLVFSTPYMHDGRFSTLNDVINHYSEGLQNSPTIDPLMKNVDQGGILLSPTEKGLIIKFLISLSDSTFITNPDFQAP
jgi:cytochrome c peroxidase